MGDETLAARVKASPRDYLNRTIVMTGGIRIHDYYNWGYKDAQESHYSLRFQEVISDPPQKLGDDCTLYLNRKLGGNAAKQIVDKIIESTTNSDWKRIRVKVMLDASRFEDHGWDLLEVLDVQFATRDGKEWEPWIMDALKEKQREARLADDKAADVEKERLAEQKRKQEAERLAADTRVWKDASGKFSVEAQYAGLLSGKVRLRKADGQEIVIELMKLSDADREWLKARAKKR